MKLLLLLPLCSNLPTRVFCSGDINNNGKGKRTQITVGERKKERRTTEIPHRKERR
jgi:hypothetical protein